VHWTPESALHQEIKGSGGDIPKKEPSEVAGVNPAAACGPGSLNWLYSVTLASLGSGCQLLERVRQHYSLVREIPLPLRLPT
jgi:hypothetical protein